MRRIAATTIATAALLAGFAWPGAPASSTRPLVADPVEFEASLPATPAAHSARARGARLPAGRTV